MKTPVPSEKWKFKKYTSVDFLENRGCDSCLWGYCVSCGSIYSTTKNEGPYWRCRKCNQAMPWQMNTPNVPWCRVPTKKELFAFLDKRLKAKA